MVHETKRVLLDSIGCAIGGLSMERGKIARRLATRLGGPPESTILGTSDKVSCDNAAFANGELINALDFDAMCPSHLTPHVLPAPLAVGESVGATGRQVIMAVALGLEIGRRVIAAGRQRYEVTPDGPDAGKLIWPLVAGYSGSTIGAAVGVGKILNFDQKKMANAIGIAGYLCPPNTHRKWTDTAPVAMTKYGSSGWGAKGGVTAALLADEGYVGDSDIFEGDRCFWRYTGSEHWNPDTVVKDLGKKWVSREISYKQYPCGL
jgi:2-methylcitrate dehydratase PrpD